MALIIRPFAYDSDEHTYFGRKGEICVENLFPRLSDEEREEQRRSIEQRLGEVLMKYSGRCGK